MTTDTEKLTMLDEMIWKVFVVMGETPPDSRVVHTNAREVMTHFDEMIASFMNHKFFQGFPEFEERADVIVGYANEVKPLGIGDRVQICVGHIDQWGAEGVVVGINTFDDQVGVRWPNGTIEWIKTADAPARIGTKSAPRVQWLDYPEEES